MDEFLTRAAARAYDAAAIAGGVPAETLMENAGRAAFAALLARTQGPVAVLCGKGNNGGDGLVIARRCAEAGLATTTELAAPPARFAGAARRAWEQFVAAGLAARVYDGDAAALTARLRGAAWAVDALLGTGFAGTPREPYAGMIEALNAAARPILAVDLPSGLDADAGTPLGPVVNAALTVTFVAPKAGFRRPAAQPYLGALVVAPILSPDA